MISIEKYKDYIKSVLQATGRGIKGYLKALLILMAVTFVILSIGFSIIGIDQGVPKALGIALLDAIPVIGSGIIMIPWVILKALSGQAELGAKIAVLYIFLVILRQILDPYITGKSVGIRPLYSFLAALVGGLVFGPVGAIGGVFVAVIIKAVLEVGDITKASERRNDSQTPPGNKSKQDRIRDKFV